VDGARPDVVLVLSADIGEGHNASGRALAEAARALWPGCNVVWLDTLDVLGLGAGPLLRRAYVSNVERTPWLYEFFYDQLNQSPAFARAAKRLVGSATGRRLRRHLERVRPDLIVSTYPIGTAGLAWLRARGELPPPTGAWVSDFFPHPFWVYPELDRTYVMHRLAVPLARAAAPAGRVEVCEPPVTQRYRAAADPALRERARADLGLDADATVVLVSGGAYAFGGIDSAVRAALAAGDGVHVLALCGRNTPLRNALSRLAPAARLQALGWVDDVPALLAASDAVVSNAGGATALEALATGRHLLMYRPIAAHGRANAELMSRAGVAELCSSEEELSAAVRRLASGGRAAAPAGGTGSPPRSLAAALADLADARSAAAVPDGRRRRHPRRSARSARQALHPADALFLAIDRPEVPQQIGAVLLLEPGGSGPVTPEVVADLVRGLPRLRGRLDRGGILRRPSWRPDPGIDVAGLVDTVDLGAPDENPAVPGDHLGAHLQAVADDFFSRPLDLAVAPARFRLVSGLPGGRQAVLLVVHHAVCDGVQLTLALVRRARGRDPDAAVPPAGRARPPRRTSRREKARRLALGVRGLWSLARAGTAPRTPLRAPVTSSRRRHAFLDLPAEDVRRAARAAGVTVTELLVGLLAQALHDAVPGVAGRKGKVRVIVPRTLGPTSGGAGAGNLAGAARVDLPVGPGTTTERVLAVSAAMRRQFASGQPQAARWVVQGLGALPPGLQRAGARLVYRSTWFSGMVTVIPGLRGSVELGGCPVGVVYPVLPLAAGVNLSVGAIPRADVVSVCLTTGPALAACADALAEGMRGALQELTGAVVPSAASGRQR